MNFDDLNCDLKCKNDTNYECCISRCYIYDSEIIINNTFSAEKMIQVFSESQSEKFLSVNWKETVSKLFKNVKLSMSRGVSFFVDFI